MAPNTDDGEVLYREHEVDSAQRTSSVRRSMTKILDRIFGISSETKRPVTVSEADLRPKDLLQQFNGQTDEEKVKLSTRSHTDCFLDTRDAKIKDHGNKTDKILNKIKKYLYTNSDKSLWKKLTQQDSIESDSKDCSKCKNSFKLFRRKHHCKLCENALCDDCSLYLETTEAEAILIKCGDVSIQTSIKTLNPLRHCEECDLYLEIIKARSEEEANTSKLMEIYNEMHNLKRQLSQTVVTYKEMYDSLIQGAVVEAVLFRDDIAQRRREIQKLGERITDIPAENESKTAELLESIKKSTNDFIMELMALPKPPTQEEVDEAHVRSQDVIDHQ